MGYTITEIEDAIIAKLKASDMGAYCKKIDSFQIEGGDLEEQIRIFSLYLPCALIVFSEGSFEHPPMRQEETVRFQVLVCAQNLRGFGDPRRGSVGTYQMLDDLRTALTGQRCGLVDIDMFTPVRVAAEINTKFFSAYSMEFETKVRFTKFW